MDECLICSESPCTCLEQQKPPVRDKGARASRRLSDRQVVDRKPVRKFSTHTDGASDANKGLIDTEASGENDELLDAIRCLAPLLSDSELRRHGVERPNSLPNLDERRRKFRAEVVWSEARYG